MSALKVCELFAGVGGLRLGLERSGLEVVWSSQWEPSTKKQHASDCYVSHFGPEGHSNEDIATVDAQDIPDHDLLVGGFPCQDYSVAATNAQGIRGKKGVLWWQIERILRAKRPKYVLLENVDRLLISPAKQRGRDFGIILTCLRDAGYIVEWRVVNAADYGFPQRRRRVFIFAFHESSPVAEQFRAVGSRSAWLYEHGLFGKAFPIEHTEQADLFGGLSGSLAQELQWVSDHFASPFEWAGVFSDAGFFTVDPNPIVEPITPLGAILEDEVPDDYNISEQDLAGWNYVKGSKDELRSTNSGFEYRYNEGPVAFPDEVDKPARTILTSEGGRKPNRCSHVVRDPKSRKLRILTPVEVERLNGFPDGWTEGMARTKRYFCMGNALVVGLIERMGRRLVEMTEG